MDRRHRASRPPPSGSPAPNPNDEARPKPYDGAVLLPDPEDFAAWCEHPVTRFVATAFAAGAEVQKRTWIRASWGGGEADPEKLIELRTRADAYLAMMQTTLPQFADFIKRVKD